MSPKKTKRDHTRSQQNHNRRTNGQYRLRRHGDNGVARFGLLTLCMLSALAYVRFRKKPTTQQITERTIITPLSNEHLPRFPMLLLY